MTGIAGSTLDDILARFNALPAEAQQQVLENAQAVVGDRRFVPNPGPQTEAYFSEADELFYGGSAGGGKSSLLCGLAVDVHTHSHLFRREAKQLRGLVEELKRIIGSNDGWNSQDQIWRLPSGRVIELGGVKDEDDKEKWQGRAASLKGFDEITQFTESQYVYIIGWNRAANGERCRVVATGNPPVTPEGYWVVKRWAPWLDKTHPNPAKPGELRWFTTIDGEDTEVAADYVGPRGERPRSRTFIPSSLEDNPDLMETGYAATIEAMPEPLRTKMREGRFDVGQADDEWQVIPSEWISLAQQRWRSDGYQGLRMTAIAADVAQGGPDHSVLSPRYGAWYAPLVVKKGMETPDGPSIASLVVMHRRDGAVVIIDVGGGYGGAAVSYLKDNEISAVGFNGSASSTAKTADGSLNFANKRAETIWRFREALDPSQEGGSAVALPPDPEMAADLASFRWKLTSRGILIEDKQEIKKRIGRSPDKGDAVLMCWNEGERAVAKRMHGSLSGRTPKVILGHAVAKKGRNR